MGVSAVLVVGVVVILACAWPLATLIAAPIVSGVLWFVARRKARRAAVVAELSADADGLALINYVEYVAMLRFVTLNGVVSVVHLLHLPNGLISVVIADDIYASVFIAMLIVTNVLVVYNRRMAGYYALSMFGALTPGVLFDTWELSAVTILAVTIIPLFLTVLAGTFSWIYAEPRN